MTLENVKCYGGVDGFVRANGIYIGRPSIFGNPYTVQQYGREIAIEMYRRWLWDEIQNRTAVYRALIALPPTARLGCFCVPQRCHGHILMNAWDWLSAERRAGKR